MLKFTLQGADKSYVLNDVYNEVKRCIELNRDFVIYAIRQYGPGKKWKKFYLLTGQEVNGFEYDEKQHIIVVCLRHGKFDK